MKLFHVPEVLNVHVNESKKKSTFFRKIFFQAVKNQLLRKKIDFFQYLFKLQFILFNCS